MEEVRDLLSSKSNKGGLKVRQHPKKGFYGKTLRSVINKLVTIQAYLVEQV